jgi:hypothetical protein
VVPGQLSAPAGVSYVTTAEEAPMSASTTISTGHVTVGASASLTVTVNEHVEVLSLASVAVQVTVDAPTGNDEPDGGSQEEAPTPGQLSETVGGA